MKSRLKGCLRCGGDLFPDLSEDDDVTFACLQCGARVVTEVGRRRAPTERLPEKLAHMITVDEVAAAASSLARA